MIWGLNKKVHITQGDVEGKAVIVSWVTQEAPGSNTVLYWKEHSSKKHKAHGTTNTYKFYNYTSGYIHHCTIRNLEVQHHQFSLLIFAIFVIWFSWFFFWQYDSKYYYVVGVGQTERKFWFFTPPKVGPDVPYTFGLIGNCPETHSWSWRSLHVWIWTWVASCCFLQGILDRLLTQT